ncbi:MAG: ankyrin repeat domain-containing protein [Nitrospirota bacterium]
MKPESRFVAGLLVLGAALVASACASPLHTAAERGDVQAVRTLLDQGAQVNEEGDPGDKWLHATALHWAAARGHLQVMELLLDRGADVNFRIAHDQTPLHWASGAGQLKAVQLLLDRGADVNAKNAYGDTALHDAAKHGHAQVVRLLLERGAMAGDTNRYGETPAAVAKGEGHPAVAQMLEQAEARQLGTAPFVASSPESASSVPPVSARVQDSDVDQPPVAGRTKQNRYAVVVGIEQYRTKLPKADFAAQDARVMGAYLTKSMGFSEENVAILVNENATRTDMEKYLEHWLPNRVEKDGTVFVYYSGHGAPNPKTGDAYLVPYDGDPSFVEATGYPLKRLYEQLGKLPAKEVVVLLDSCFSGAGGRSVIAKGMRPMVLSVENPVLAGGKTVVLAASKGDQVSSTYDQKGHGLLTYFFLKGLRGEADANKDGSVDLAEVYEYLKPQVERTARREFNNDQTPQLLGSPGLLSKGVRLVERAGTSKP